MPGSNCSSAKANRWEPMRGIMIFQLAARPEVRATLMAAEYREIKTDYDRISRVHFWCTFWSTLRDSSFRRQMGGVHPKRFNTVDDGVEAIQVGRFWYVTISVPIISCMYIFIGL